MDENELEGAAQNVAGKVQNAAGGLMGDTKTQAQGKAREIGGKLQENYGAAADQVKDYASTLSERIQDQPLIAVGIAAGIGYLLGTIGKRL